MTTKEINEITKAVLEGKPIQVKKNGVWETIYGEPQWHFDHCEYRIKPETKLTPYALAEEFVDEQAKHGPNLKVIWADEKDLQCYAIPIRITDNYIEVCLFNFNDDEGAPREITYDKLLEGCDSLLFYWQDGTPCGIIENEKQL